VTAQNGTLTGRVTDSETGDPLNGVVVEVLAATGSVSRGTYTDPSGLFSVSLGAGTYSIRFSLIGRESERVDGIDIAAGGTEFVEVALATGVINLDQIVVSVSKKAEKAVEAPATVTVVGEQQIAERPAPTPVEHIRSAPGVDVATHGIQAANVVVRGFNNIFSGALHALTDNRIAGIPSLRVNLFHFIPANSEDIDRMEVVLGPGSALYGPNTANGVVHIITKSPLTHQGTTVSIGGGERSVFQADFRTAHLIGDDFGFKISGQYLQGNEWRYTDPVEAAARLEIDTNRAAAEQGLRDLGVTDENEIDLRLGRIGNRDFDLQRWGVEARADWRFNDGGTWVFSAGRTNADGIELTGIGAGQTNDWAYSYYQTRLNWNRLFAQVYLNTSDAGDSFLLRDGANLVDKSKLLVGQLQHGFDALEGRQGFTYGVDWFRTMPETESTIHGQYEDDDEINEVGVYLQSETALTDYLDLVLAGRFDKSSILDDPVWSPRAALVVKPDDDQSFRLTYNRAFSTPTTLNYFLDINAGRAPGALGSLGYLLRAQGPGKDGLSFQAPDGSLRGMRSAFTPAALGGPAQLLPPDVATLWQFAVGILQQQGAIDAQTAALLGSLQPSNDDIGLNLFNPIDLSSTPLSPGALPDIPPLEASHTETFEVGYQGVLGDRLLVSADVWRSEKTDFTSPLVLRTPLLTLNRPDIAAYLVPRLVAAGVPQPIAEAQAGALAAGIAPIPLAVVSSDDVRPRGADLVVTYVNFGKLDLWGADLGFTALLSDEWTLSGSTSWVSDHHFEVEDELIALNAPDLKGTASLAYRNADVGFSGEFRLRYNSEFPVNSADFIGTQCVLDPGVEPGPFVEECVESFTLADVTLGYAIPGTGATLQLTVSNLFDTDYRNFIGVPTIGRFALARLRYEL
jgi:iron complex outermembrane receptor protein